MGMARRAVVVGAAAIGASLTLRHPARAAEENFFDLSQPVHDWETVSGNWVTEDVAGASAGRALVQRATDNEYNVILAPGSSYENVLVSVRFKPMAGRADGSGGNVFRF